MVLHVHHDRAGDQNSVRFHYDDIQLPRSLCRWPIKTDLKSAAEVYKFLKNATLMTGLQSMTKYHMLSFTFKLFDKLTKVFREVTEMDDFILREVATLMQ